MKVALKMTYIVNYDLNNTPVDEVKENLRRAMIHIEGEGMLTGYSDAEIENIDSEIEEI